MATRTGQHPHLHPHPHQDSSYSFSDIHQAADIAGRKAAADCRPTPMVVQSHADPLDDSSPVTQQWLVSGGPCGFAWVHWLDGRCKAARWAKEHLDGIFSADKGVIWWIHNYGQSLARKEAFASAYAEVWHYHGYKVVARSRLD